MSENNLSQYCLDVARRAKAASRALASVPGSVKNAWLDLVARKLVESETQLLDANALDLAAAREAGLSPAMIDRLTLSAKTLAGMAQALREIAAFPDPIGETIGSSMRPNGFEVRKVRSPLGVVFFVYESRPNVTTDAAAICVKSGNAVILRGGKEALHSNLALATILADASAEVGMPRDAVQILNTTDRDAIDEFLHMPEYVDVAIPRGGAGLVRRVATEAKMHVIKHFAGNCFVYVDKSANLDTAEKILLNSKMQRLGTCNTAESLLIHAGAAKTSVPKLLQALANAGCELRGDAKTRALAGENLNVLAATDEDFDTEYLAAIISIKIVDSIDEAIDFINEHSSGHTEAIVAQDVDAINRFTRAIDSAAVMVNSSTRLHDGGQFGLGAEIGISTDKFHARGPCGVNELTSYKYVVYGDGAVRE